MNPKTVREVLEDLTSVYRNENHYVDVAINALCEIVGNMKHKLDEYNWCHECSSDNGCEHNKCCDDIIKKIKEG